MRSLHLNPLIQLKFSPESAGLLSMLQRYYLSLLLIALAFLPIYSCCASEPDRILFLGDSLTAGYGLTHEEAYPALIQKKASAEGIQLEIRNAGVSGDTSAGALRRISWLLKDRYDLVLIAIGANDGLRGQPVNLLERNLLAIIDTIKTKDPSIRIMMAGMRLPLNFGPDYIEQFEGVFEKVAKNKQIYFFPFLLEGVARVEALNLSDGLHPNAEGQALIAQNLWPKIKELLRKSKGSVL